MVAAKQTAGCSGTPLPQKLGLKDGQVVGFAGLPASQKALLKSRAFAFAEQVDKWNDFVGDSFDVVHVFTKSAEAVQAALPMLQSRIKPDGMIWMSWPKKASKIATDVTEDTIRDCALNLDLVDVKVCAVDEIWSGLKVVIRKEHRAKYAQISEGLKNG